MSDLLLMIPGPIEVSPAVQRAFAVPPPSHLAPHVIEAFGASLEKMRRVWRAGADSQPFLVAGSGTSAMEMAATNLIEPGDRALVYHTGYFSERMAEMLRRRGAQVEQIKAPPGEAAPIEEVQEALAQGKYKALFVTHVDTSTGVLADARALAQAARAAGALSVFDGVCATVAEDFAMEAWGADVYLTSSQKAVGLPVGLALMVASPRAMEARQALTAPPPMSLDWHQWLPIMQAYEQRQGSYFSTPATNLVLALDVALREILESEEGDLVGAAAASARHIRVARAMRAAWAALGLELVVQRPELAAHSLSALRYPRGVNKALLDQIKARGVVVAGGLYKGLQHTYFRVGHMGWVTTQPHELIRTVAAIGGALVECGHPADVGAALGALNQGLAQSP